MFFGVRDGDEEVYYLNPEQLEIRENILIQKQQLCTFSSQGVSLEKVIVEKIYLFLRNIHTAPKTSPINKNIILPTFT